MIRSIYYLDNQVILDQASSEFTSLLQEPGGVLWVDLEGNPREQDETLLHDVFNFHPLAIDDALQEAHVPKLDDWGQYLYIVLHAVVVDPNSPEMVTTQELDVFLGMNYMVTHHDYPIEAVNKTWKYLQRDLRHFKNGADSILYRLIDELVASYMPVVESLDAQIDDAEDIVFRNAPQQILETIFALKRSVLYLRRIISPMREVLNKLARDDFEVIDVRARIYFRDVYDHLVRLYDITENLRDLVSGTLDIYLSVINNRMNDIMKTLTVFTAMFMPLTFLTGFYGMNFFAPTFPLDYWVSKPIFTVVNIIILTVPIAMIIWMRRKRWL